MALVVRLAERPEAEPRVPVRSRRRPSSECLYLLPECGLPTMGCPESLLIGHVIGDLPDIGKTPRKACTFVQVARRVFVAR